MTIGIENTSKSVRAYVYLIFRFLELPISKVDFLICTGIYMLPSNLNLNLRKVAEYNNKILVSNIDMKISSFININKVVVYHQKFIQSQSPFTFRKLENYG